MVDKNVLLPSGQAVTVRRPYSQGATYLDAFKETKGNLPGNLTHKYLLVDTDLYEQVKSGYSGWAREVLAKPENGQHFQKGIDIKDAKTGWTIPASYVKDATGGDPYKPGIGLFIDLASFDENKGVVLIPKSTVVVENLQESGEAGKVDEKTGLIVKVKDFGALEWAEKGWNFYPETESARPLARGYGPDLYYFNWRLVVGYLLPSAGLGMLELVAQLAPKQL